MRMRLPRVRGDEELDRRSFLGLASMLGLGVATVGLGFVSSEAVRLSRKLYKVSETRIAMKTFVSMTLIHPSRDEAEEAMGRAYEEIDRLAGFMNRFDQRSAVSLQRPVLS